MYNEVHADPKVQTLPPLVFRAWVNLMCLASVNGGPLPSISDIAFRLHVSETKALYYVDFLKGKQLIEAGADGQLQMHNWNGRQFSSDVSTDRVKRFRERHGNVSETVNETFHETKEKVSPTPPSKRKTDSETETPKPPPSVEEYSPGFEAFWVVYPKKHGKGDAYKAWRTLNPSQVLQEIMIKAVSAAKLSKDWTKENGQFIPDPAKWIRHRKWDDELTPQNLKTVHGYL